VSVGERVGINDEEAVQVWWWLFDEDLPWKA
jgi:hypothetical protein